jgi:hypothetical protein
VAKPDTSPLRVHGAILVDEAQRELDEARRIYRREYDRGHALSERGLWKQGEEIVDAADAKLRRAERRLNQTPVISHRRLPRTLPMTRRPRQLPTSVPGAWHEQLQEEKGFLRALHTASRCESVSLLRAGWYQRLSVRVPVVVAK